MIKPRRYPLLSLVLAATLLPVTPTSARDAVSETAGDGRQVDRNAVRISNVRKKMSDRITQADREAAAANLKALKAKLAALKKEAAAKAAADAKAMGISLVTETPPGVAAPGPGDVPDYFTTANWAFSPPLRKFVDTLAGLGPTGANNLGNYIPVAVPDKVTYPGSDYYEISLRQYTQQLHSDLDPTTLRGYVQTNSGISAPGATPVAPAPIFYLGPVIVAEKDRPVRIKFTNELPSGPAGALNIPVDESVMGAGVGPLFPDGSACDPTPPALENCAKYPQNRAAIHLHGGRTPWISDGTPHQWVVPAADELDANQPYKKGVSYANVPDMPDPGAGAVTYYYSNQQSARLMFYHDHAWGITRLNVIVGEAAGYLVTDAAEQALVTAGVLPADQIPLVIQDRSFVDPATVRTTDPTWNWGSGTPDANGVRPPKLGDFWIPHVYMPAQNPYDQTGANPYGRWVYGPWFFPPTNNILHGPVPNPYHDPACSSTDPAVFVDCTTPGQPPVIPGTPNVSVGMETFFDTAMVNGVAFPRLPLLPKAYRFRILNAANDRFMNLSLYEVDPAQPRDIDGALTEVKMVPASVTNIDTATYPLWPVDGRDSGVPDPTTMGPPFIQVGTESGFLPRPVQIFSQPIGYYTDPTVFNVGNVKDHALLLGPAERADVVIDFSGWRGKSLILYNDAPAAFPARDARVDYYAGAGDLSDSGGHWGPQVGYGPNTRTIMRIDVADVLPAAAFDYAALVAAMAPDLGAAGGPRPGVFEASQDPILVGQAAYNGVYTNAAGTDFVTFPSNWPAWGFARIQDYNITFKTVGGTLQTFPLEPKGIHDEMGAAFDHEYGRMSGNLGMSIPFAQVGVANFTLYDFTDPATEVLNDAVTPLSPVLGDGTQIWKISQNGVDTHPIHFHVFDVQLLNRVGWDGLIRPPEANELGWKETVRISPLEDTVVAMRMWAPKLPFGIPNSLRPLNPGIPLGSPYGFTNIDPITQQPKVPADVNRVEDFGWEYVWHCHILSHEEMDMMRPVVLNVETVIPLAPALTAVENAGAVDLTWTDWTPVNYVDQTGFGSPAAEIGFRIERATGPTGAFGPLADALANQVTYKDTTAAAGTYYRYRVIAYNAAGTATSPIVGRDLGGGATPVDSVSLAAAPATTPYARTLPTVGNPADGSVVFTATPVGGVGLFEYQFSISTDAVNYTTVQPFSASDSWTMPATQPAAAYTVKVEARTAATQVAPYPEGTLAYEVQSNPATLVTVAAAPASPSLYATPVVFTATATGGAATKEYQFSLSTNGGAFSVVRPWGATTTWTMPSTTLPASFVVKAEVRTDLSPSGLADGTVAHVVKYPAATGLTLGASKASPAVKTIIPSTILFTAAATGSQGYSYRFELFDGATTTVVRDWAAGSTWTMPADQAAGTYVVTAKVSTDGGLTVDRTALRNMVLVYRSATGVSVAATPATRQNPGTPVTFTATGVGSAGYHYRFLRSLNGAPAVEVQAWGPSNTYTMTGAAEGSYAVTAEVWANATPPLTATAEATSAPVTVQQRLAPPATVTLTPDRASPAAVNIVPVPTVFSAAATGSSGYQFRFWLDSGTGFTLVQDYGVGSTWTLPASTPIGTYQVKVDVKTSALVDLDLSTTVSYVLQAPPAATGVTVSSNVASPQPPGTTVTFTAAGQGSSGYQYKFWFFNGAAWSVARDWSAEPTWSLPLGLGVGSYVVSAQARTRLSSSGDATSSNLAYTLAYAPATGVTLTADRPSPQIPGTPVVFTAAGQGSSNYQYRFWFYNGVGWSIVQNYSPVATWTLPTSLLAGTYLVGVEVRTMNTVVRDAASPNLTFVLSAPPATGVTVSANKVSPQVAGTEIIFTATGFGSVGYQYRFWMHNGVSWSVVQDWSTTATWNLPGSASAGTYLVSAEVRTSPTVTRDAVAPNVSFVIQNPPATGVTLAAAPVSPSAAGTQVAFKATATGSAGYQYQFWLNEPGQPWRMVQAYGTSDTYVLPTTKPAGTYLVGVEVRTNSTVARDVVSPNLTHVLQ